MLEWIRQFPAKERTAIRAVAAHILFVNEQTFLREMRALNNRLLIHLKEQGVDERNIIYVSFDDAGSSSAVVLNAVRDACHLERRGCKLKDGHDVRGISDLTGDLGKGAIVYVDDFAGSGNQFVAARTWLGQYVVGNFSEYFLVHTVCEEGLEAITAIGVDTWKEKVHARADRPLHSQSTLVSAEHRALVRSRCQAMDAKGGLGYKEMAAMVVLFRNAPNCVPLVLRGNLAQRPIFGVFPRTTDLPVPEVHAG